jgi:hypothetical protein
MAAKMLFPPGYEPVPRPGPPVPVTVAERNALRDAVLAEMAGTPMRYGDLIPLMQAIVGRLTNDDCVELLDWAMAQWHGADPSAWPTYYEQAEE